MSDKPHPSFESHREPIWEQLATQLQGTFHDEDGWKRDKVAAHVGPWRIVLDIHVYPGWRMQEHFTRLRAPFINADGFTFQIYRNGPLAQFADFTGIDRATQDIKIGEATFDRHFTVAANNPAKMQRLLSSERIRQLLEAVGDIRLAIRADDGEFGPYFPPGVDELRLETPDRVNDLKRLRGLYDLLAEVLRALCQIGSAYEKDPKIEL